MSQGLSDQKILKLISEALQRPKNAFWLNATDNSEFTPTSYDPGANHLIKGKKLFSPTDESIVLEDPSDLKNLRFISIKQAKEFKNKLEIQAEKSEVHKIVGLVATGGTIAMKAINNILVPDIDIDYLVDTAGNDIKGRFGFASLNFPYLMDSSEMEIDYLGDIVLIQYWIWNNASPELKEKLTGFMIAHGTDTLATSATAVAMMHGPDCPFSTALVGAQKTSQDRYSDVGVNIYLAIETLDHLHTEAMPTTFIYMGGHTGGALSAVGAMKASDRQVDGFISPAHPKLIDTSNFAEKGINSAFLKAYRPIIGRYRPVILRGYAPIKRISPEPGTDPLELYKEVLVSDAQFVVLETLATFTINPKHLNAVKKALELKGSILFVTKPFPDGKIDHAYESAVLLRNSGAHITEILPPALKTKLMLASKIFRNSPEKIVKFICQNNFVGEQPPSLLEKHNNSKTSESTKIELGAPREFYSLESKSNLKLTKNQSLSA